VHDDDLVRQHENRSKATAELRSGATDSLPSRQEELFLRSLRSSHIPPTHNFAHDRFGFGFLYYGLVFLTARLFSEEGEEGKGGKGGEEGGIDIEKIAINSLSEIVGTLVVFFTVDIIGRRTSQVRSDEERRTAGVKRRTAELKRSTAGVKGKHHISHPHN